MRWPWVAAILAILGTAWLIAVPRWDLPIGGARYWALAWGTALLLAALYVADARASWRQGAGMALMLVSLTSVLIAILNDLAPLFAGGTVLQAISTTRLSNLFARSLLTDLGYVGVGYLLWSGWHPRDGIDVIATRLRQHGLPMGGRSEAASMHVGWLLLPVILFASAAIQLIASSQAPQLINSDETSVWDNMTPYHGIMISAAAAVGEEVVYRGFMMVAGAMLLQRLRVPSNVAWSTSLVAQGIIFGFAHGGYGNWLHVIQATLFGLLAGAMALRFGIWSATTVHFLIDIYAIGGHADLTWWLVALTTLLLVNTLYTLIWSGQWAWQWWQARQAG